MIRIFRSCFYLLLLLCMNKAMAQTNDDPFLLQLLSQKPELFADVLKNKMEWNVQIIYTQIDRDKKGKPRFTDHTFNVDPNRYYYPASTVKLPTAILALQYLNELKRAGLDKNTTMLTDSIGYRQSSVSSDTTAANGKPSIAHYIKKILLVSDNDAFNRLYELLGQEYINNSLHRMGYDSVQIIHRLDIFRTEEENRQTNPVRFVDEKGNLIFLKPAENSRLIYAKRDTKMGKGFMRVDQLINEPFDFSKKNRLPLADLHSIVKSIIFPEFVPKKQRFNLTKEDLEFLRKYMSMFPSESDHPSYDSNEVHDTYVKFLYYGAEKITPQKNLRIFNKPGDAYGFMIDAAYIIDYENKVEFLLSAVIHCNSDGIFNDDKYDYETIGKPFMKNLGRTIYEYELKRKKKHN